MLPSVLKRIFESIKYGVYGYREQHLKFKSIILLQKKMIIYPEHCRKFVWFKYLSSYEGKKYSFYL